MWPSVRTCISAKARPRPRKTATACGSRAACRTIAPWATWPRPIRYLRSMPYLNGKVGIIGYCSGGRQAYLAACTLPGIDAAVDCYGGGVAGPPGELTPLQPVDPLDYTKNLSCPLLGLFGKEDQRPSPAQVAKTEAELKKWGKTYEFHSYDKAGHSFFAVDRPSYRPEAAVDGWEKVFQWFGKYLR